MKGRNKILIFYLSISFILLPLTIYAFETFGVQSSPRADALAGAYTAVAGDSESITHNPAGIAFAKNEILFSYKEWFGDVNLNQLNILYSKSQKIFYGLSIKSSSIDFTEFSSSGEQISSQTYLHMNFVPAISFVLSDSFVFGFCFNFISRDIGKKFTLTSTIGGIYKIPAKFFNILKIETGVVIANYLNFTGDNNIVPPEFKVGINLKFPYKLFMPIDIRYNQQDKKFILNSGLGIRLNTRKFYFIIRGGLPLIDEFKRFTAGAEVGIKKNNMNIGVIIGTEFLEVEQSFISGLIFNF